MGIGPVGNNGIAYNLGFLGFSLAATTSPNAPPAGLIPESAPNEIAFGPTDPQTITAGFAQVRILTTTLSYHINGNARSLSTTKNPRSLTSIFPISIMGVDWLPWNPLLASILRAASPSQASALPQRRSRLPSRPSNSSSMEGLSRTSCTPSSILASRACTVRSSPSLMPILF